MYNGDKKGQKSTTRASKDKKNTEGTRKDKKHTKRDKKGPNKTKGTSKDNKTQERKAHKGQEMTNKYKTRKKTQYIYIKKKRKGTRKDGNTFTEGTKKERTK